ncbi:MAG TPA: hypothetical protein PLZ84_02050 [Clostridia bacterium]|nr:hypothetical protein [Clostridia bacterium]
MRIIKQYKKPITLGLVFLVMAVSAFCFGLYLTDVMGNSLGYTLIFFALTSFALGFTIITAYSALNMRFKNALGYPLMYFELDASLYKSGTERKIREINAENKTALTIMLCFCMLFAAIGFFVIEDGYAYGLICTGVSVFLTVVEMAVTGVRVKKVKKGRWVILLARDGAYIGGDFHCWRSSASYAINVLYKDVSGQDGIAGYIEVDYVVMALPAQNVQKCIIPIPAEYVRPAKEAVRVIISSMDNKQTLNEV